MLRKALLILSGNAAASLLLFARNLVIARLIPVEDYGIASTFAIAMSVVEMASQLGLQQMIVQAREGEDPHFQAALQGFQVLRGVISGVVLFLAAGLVADFLNIPEVAWAYQVMALVPVLNALQHFDIHRMNRDMRFWPLILTGAVPALLSLAVLWPLTAWFGDYRVMLYALIVQAAIATITSHATAERPYRLVLDRAIMARSLAFGWPLLINGFLLFAVFQGDKLIVGRELGMAPLAIFSMGVTLTLTPTLVLGKSAQNFFLPQLGRLATSRDEDPAPFATVAQAMLQATLLSSCLLVVAILLLGPLLVSVALGDKYAELIPLLALFAVQQGLRSFRTGPNVIALSGGHTVNAMLSNAVRVASLPLAWWVIAGGGSIASLLTIAVIAEILGFMVAMAMAQRSLSLSFRPSWPAISLSALIMLTVGMTFVSPGLATVGLWSSAILFVPLVWSMKEFRHSIRAAA